MPTDPSPAWISSGTAASSAAAVSIPAPSGTTAGDLKLLLVATANQAITIANTGWAEVTGSPQFTGTAAAAGGVRLGVYYIWATNSTSYAVTVNDSGDLQYARQILVRNVSNTNPFNATVGVARAASTNVNCPGVVTTEDHCLILSCIGLDKDLADSDTITSWFPPSGAQNTAEVFDATVATGFGGGVALYRYTARTAGATGNVFGTADSSTTRAYLTIALSPVSSGGSGNVPNRKRYARKIILK